MGIAPGVRAARPKLPPFFTVTHPVPTYYTVNGIFSLPGQHVRPIHLAKLEIVGPRL